MSECETLNHSLANYRAQLVQIESAINNSQQDEEKQELITLRDNINELIVLTNEQIDRLEPTHSNYDQDEYALFKAAIEEDSPPVENELNLQEDFQKLEGMKCRAPHVHQWGSTEYHNAIITSVIPCDNPTFAKIEVKVLFINPIEQKMLPCPYFLEGNCKFSKEQCRYSHGEIVPFSTLQEYSEPNFHLLKTGCKVLVKAEDKLWYKGTIKRVYSEKCLVRTETAQNELEVEFHDIFPCDGDEIESEDTESENDYEDDVINTALTTIQSNQVLGDWEKYTKGFGSKLMVKMGYVVGSGLGKLADGRVEPVSAVVLPSGKSLDYCMHLKEKLGDEKDLFSVERKLKRLQKKQEIRNKKIYEKEKNNVNVFNFLNNTLSGMSSENVTCNGRHREEIRKETSRNLNVAHMQIEEEMKKIKRDLYKIKESLDRHSNSNSHIHKQLKAKLKSKQDELEQLKKKSTNISREQTLRSDKKKWTVF